MMKVRNLIYTLFLLLPIVFPVTVWSLGFSSLDLLPTLIAFSLALGGIQYVSYLIYVFGMKKRNFDWLECHILEIPVSFSLFYIMITPILMLLYRLYHGLFSSHSAAKMVQKEWSIFYEILVFLAGNVFLAICAFIFSCIYCFAFFLIIKTFFKKDIKIPKKVNFSV